MTARLAFLTIASLVAGCGDDAQEDGGGSGEGTAASGESDATGPEDMGSCPPPLATCDGDPVGLWAAVAICDPVHEDCRTPVSVEIESAELGPSMLEVRADGTVDAALDGAFQIVSYVPLSCVPPEYQTLGCPGGEPCRVSAGFSVGVSGNGVWSDDGGGGDRRTVVVDPGDLEERRGTLCVDGDEAVFVLESKDGIASGATFRLERFMGG